MVPALNMWIRIVLPTGCGDPVSSVYEALLDGFCSRLYHRSAEVAKVLSGCREVVGGTGSALRNSGTVRGTGPVESEPESLSPCLLLKPRTNCSLRNFKSINELA
jgi:hypothetical protein